jgi:hypothetical protein
VQADADDYDEQHGHETRRPTEVQNQQFLARPGLQQGLQLGRCRVYHVEVLQEAMVRENEGPMLRCFRTGFYFM